MEESVAQLCHVCASNHDAALFDCLEEEGVSLAEVMAECDKDYFGNKIVRDVVINATTEEKVESAKVFLTELLHRGATFGKRKQSTPFLINLVSTFSDDLDLLEKMAGAGCSFTCEGDYASGKDCQVLYRLLADGKTSGAAFLLSHGATMRGGSSYANRIWSLWRRDPCTLAEMVLACPPDSIEPVSDILPVVARSGSVRALEALESWEGAYTEYGIDAAIEAASEEGHVETSVFLFAKKDRDFPTVGWSLELDDEFDSPELVQAIQVGAVSTEKVLVDAEKIMGPNKVIDIPEGVTSIASRVFRNLYGVSNGCFVTLPGSVVDFHDETFRNAGTVVLPPSLEHRFEGLFLHCPKCRVIVRSWEGVLRAVVPITVRTLAPGRMPEGDLESVRNASMEGVSLQSDEEENTAVVHEHFTTYLRNIDCLFADGSIRYFANKARIAVSRLTDKTCLIAENEACYTQFIRENSLQCFRLFESEQDSLFSDMLKTLLEESELDEL